MDLNDQQKQDIRNWLAEGANLSDVQQRLLEEHDISMTYMDVRLMVLEIGAEVQDKPEPKPRVKAAPDKQGAVLADDGSMGEELPGGVQVTVDRVVQPGALTSGTVAFSDGVTANWQLDQTGRLALTNASQADYRPSQEDIDAFQLELEAKLSSGSH